MNRVALFFDGMNFDLGRRVDGGNASVDMSRLADWLVARAGGGDLWAANYYTGVERPADGAGRLDPGQASLLGVLTMLQFLPGFFVTQLSRRDKVARCPNCEHEYRFSVEKEVDTTIVADMIRLAAVDAFDVAVLVSGDADFAPGAAAVRALGKKVLVATWGTTSLANRLREVVYDTIDLRDGLDSFLREGAVRPLLAVSSGPGNGEPEPNIEPGATRPAPAGEVAGPADPADARPSPDPADPGSDAPAVADDAASTTPDEGIASQPSVPPPPDLGGAVVVGYVTSHQSRRADPEAFLTELRRALQHFAHGYVGRSYFLKHWRSDALTESFAEREELLDQLVQAEVVEVYTAEDGSLALRVNDTDPRTTSS
ncbi:MAG: NYN domain-containing protein [Chloroflexota bacterium]